MDFAPVYLLQRCAYRFVDFFHHWYVDGSRTIGRRFIAALEEVDRVIALRVTFRYFFQPLYGDFSGIGRVLGVIFRTGRILVGLVIYAVVVAAFLAFYLLWIAFPAAVILYAVAYAAHYGI